MSVEMKQTARLGQGLLIITSGILTAISGIPFLRVSPGTLFDQNFRPVTTQALSVIVLLAISLGLFLAFLGVMLVLLNRLNTLFAFLAMALTITNMYTGMGSSTSALFIASLMGFSGGFLAALSTVFKGSVAGNSDPTLRTWFTCSPFGLLVMGSWTSGSLLSVCSPPVGFGSGCGEPLPPFLYLIIFIIGGATISSISTLVLYVVHKRKATAAVK